MSFNFVIPEFNIGGAGTPPLQFFRRGFNLGGGGSTPEWQDIILSGNTALTLVNAKANGLNYLKLFGGTEQRNIPSEYTQLEFLQSDGACYIDLLRVPNNNDIIEQKFQKVGTSPTTCSWYGSMPSSQQITPRIGIGTFNSQGAQLFAGTNYTGTISDADTNIHTLRFQATGRQELTYTLDGVTAVIDASTVTTPPDMYEPAIELTSYLFARHGTNGVQVYDNEGTKIYYHREYLANGTLVLNMIPVKRNSDNVLGMYDLVSGQFFTNQGTGSFVAGATAVPTPDTPMDIVSNNGVIKFNANLLDANTITTGYYIKDNGVITEQSNAFYSALIPVKPNTSYVFSRVGTTGQYIRIHGYDANGDWQEMLAKTDTTSDLYLVATTESNTSYVRISARVGTDMEFKLGDTYPTNIITYTDGTVETVGICENLLDIHETKATSLASAIAVTKPTYAGVNQGSTWTVGNNANFGANAEGIVIPCKSGEKYSLKIFNSTAFGAQGRYTYGEMNSEGKITKGNTAYSSTLSSGCTITAENDGFLCIQFAVNTTEEKVISAQIKVVKGDTIPTTYYDGGSATAEMLLKIGTYQDVQSVLDGKVTRNVGVKVLDGTENWVFATNLLNYMYSLPMSDLYAESTSVTSDRLTPYCTHFNRSTNWVSGISRQGFVQAYQPSTGDAVLGLGYGTASSANLNTFKTWLATQYNAGTPVIVVYPLATATTESVTGQPLTIQAGTNIVEITQASIDNLELEVSYKGTV